ncbi:polysaccharide deacetylase, partial [Eggerthella lenta]
MAAFAVGGYFVVQSLPASITLNGANLEVGGHKTLEDALRA